MSVLVVGISHKTAPVALLERLALDRDGLVKLITDVTSTSHVGEATVIATCNRLEIYAEVDRFHGSVEELSRLLTERAGEPAETLVPHLYVHYDDAAVAHLFQVSAGLDSMVVGEAQILGQAREALRIGQELATIGPALNSLFQQALRVGKKVRAETDLDHAAPSLVTAALEQSSPDAAAVTGRRVLILGAGSMAAVATATVSRLGAADIAIVNRTAGNADRLAAEHSARAVAYENLSAELARADVLIACTGAMGHLITRADLAAALGDGREFLAVDLAMPHDIEPDVADLPGVTLIGLADLAERLSDSSTEPGTGVGRGPGAGSGAGAGSGSGSGSGVGADIAQVRRIVSGEVAAFGAARRASRVTPTVVALRSMATGVVDAEIERLDSRLPGLDPAVRAEVVATLRRVSDKLLHQPTVRVRELAEGEAVSYAAALAELFALDPEAVEAVTRVEGL